MKSPVFFFQFLNTRSHKGEKDKTTDKDRDSGSDVEETNLSLMDRTKRQAKAAREQQRRNVDASAKDEVQDLEEIVLQTRERVKAAKSRAAALCRELQELQEEEEEESIAVSEEAVPVSAPVPDASDPGAFVATSLQSAVNRSYLFVGFLDVNFIQNR